MKCKACRQPFKPRNGLQRVCGFECALALVKKQKERSAAKLAKEERRERATALAKLKTAKELKGETQTACNRLVKRRDYGKPCICCGKPMPWGNEAPGGSIDAGHFLSVGSCPELRYNLDNIHAQLKSCNRPGGTTRAKFREGMIARIGLEAVEALEGPHPPAKWTRDELIEMRTRFNRMARELDRS